MIATEAGHDYARYGWGVVPLYGIDAEACRCHLGRACPEKNRGKHPSSGNDWQTKPLRGGADIEAWYETHPHDNIGVATGPGSGIWILDVDGAQGVATISAMAREHGALPPTRLVRTGSGGLHYYYKHPGHFTVHNSSSWLGPGIDVRGKNGQVVAPPSVSGRGPYELLADHPVAEAPDWLLALVAEHAANCEAGRTAEVKAAERVDMEFMHPRIRDLASTIIGVDQGRYRHFHSIVAACYETGYTQGQAVTITAPWCAAVDKFVNRVAQEVARSWAKLEADAKKQNEWVDGIAGPQTQTAPNPTRPDPDPPVTDLPAPTWRPVDLTTILDGTYTPETPTLMTRTDSRYLLYPGRIHSFHGESESGKSLLIQAETAQQIRAGRDVLYVDFESDATAVVGRLLELGASPDQIRTHFTYLRPDTDPRKFVHERQALAAVLTNRYSLAVIDGMTDALGIFGAASKDNDEVSAFMRAVPRLIATKTGAAVVVIDHVAKDADTRGRFAIGGQAKMAALDGAAYVVEVVDALGRGIRGVITLRIAKDRPGGIRPNCGPFRKTDRTQEAAKIIVDSTNGGTVITIQAPTQHVGEAPKPFRPTTLMERISNQLAAAATPLSLRSITKNGGHERAIREALEVLIDETYVTVEAGPNRTHMHWLERPYVADQDPLSDTYSGWIDPPVSPVSPSVAKVSPENGASECRQVAGTPKGTGDTQRPAGDTEKASSVANTCTSCGRSLPKAITDVMGGLCGACAIASET